MSITQITTVHLILHVNNIAKTLHGGCLTNATCERNIMFLVDNTAAVFVKRKDTDGRVEFQGEENKAKPEHSNFPHDDSNDEEAT